MSTNTKPVAEWTAQEMQDLCVANGGCCDCCQLNDRICMVSNKDLPSEWKLTERPHFTEDEVATMKVLYGAGERTIERDEYGTLWTGTKRAERKMALPASMLPFILPGASVTIEDIIGQKENRPG